MVRNGTAGLGRRDRDAVIADLKTVPPLDGIGFSIGSDPVLPGGLLPRQDAE